MDRKMQTDCKQSLNAALPGLVQEYTSFIAACNEYPQYRSMTTKNVEEYCREVLTVRSVVITSSNPRVVRREHEASTPLGVYLETCTRFRFTKPLT